MPRGLGDERISRREALRRMGLAAASLAVGGLSAFAQRRRPNFVVIITDDQRWDAMSCVPNRFPFLKTPNIDRLAREGARFANAFVVISLCSPSRSCFLTGRYAHATGVFTNEGMEFPPEMPTYPSLLKRAGYSTAFLGKWHMRPDSSPRPGFDYWFSFRGQGTYFDPVVQENDRVFKAKGYMTDILTERAVAWLKRQDGPFCLVLSHKAAHGPFSPAPRHRNAFADAEVPEPPSFKDTFRNKPRWLRRSMLYGARRAQWEASEGKPVPDELPPGKWDPRNKTRLNYLRCMLGIDESVGQVLQTLEEMGVLDDTVVVFTSDNGFFLGEHRRGDKRLAYEESIRIPLLVRYPPLARAGSVIEQMALNVDLLPTICELAGIEPPRDIHGRSLVPLLRGQARGWRDRFLYEYYIERWLPGIPTMLALRTERWKYITYPHIDDLDELYDLRADPYEMNNLAVDPDYADVVNQMRQQLDELKAKLGWRDKPKPVVKMMQVAPELVLAYDFRRVEGDRVLDGSGKSNNGQLHGAKVEQMDGRAVCRFDGKSYISVPKSPSLNPAARPFTIEARFRAEAPNGVVLARGGESHGYALFLENGRPCFAIRADASLYALRAPIRVVGQWVTVRCVLTKGLEMRIYVNGNLVAERSVELPIVQDPNEILTIGMDTGTKVGRYGQDNGFRGLMDEVRIWQGAVAPEKRGELPLPAPVLLLSFDQDQGSRVVDGSGSGAEGRAVGAPLVDGRKGKARRFDGSGRIEISGEGLALEPGPVVIAAWVRPQERDGCIFSWGGHVHGIALYLSGGKPVVAVRRNKQVETAAAEAELPLGQWSHVCAAVTADGAAAIYVNGRRVGGGKLTSSVAANPAEGPCVGADVITPVGPYEVPFGFKGDIDELAVYLDELLEQQIARMAR